MNLLKPLALALVAIAATGCVVHPVGHGRSVLLPHPGVVVGAVVATAIAASVVGGVTYVNQAPPQPVYENYGQPPAVGMIWTPGYHYWQGNNYVWRNGNWAHPPHRGATWQVGYWSRHSHGHYWVPGHWR
jgi:WXXGXW repeat (2 copies)